MFGGEEALVHGLGLVGLTEFGEQVGILGHQAEACQEVEVKPVVGGGNEKEQIGGPAIRRTERDLLDGSAQGEEG